LNPEPNRCAPARDAAAESAPAPETAGHPAGRDADVPSTAGIPSHDVPMAPSESWGRGRLRALAIAMSAVMLFCGVVGTGSTLVVWSMFTYDLLRPDFYLFVFAASGSISFLLRLLGLRGRGLLSRAFCVALNLGCIAFAQIVALLRWDALGQPMLAGVLLLLTVAPALNIAVLLTDPAARE
jgi:hypothetical protein